MAAQVSAGVVSLGRLRPSWTIYIPRPCQTSKCYLVWFLPPSTNTTQFYSIKLASPVAQLSQTRDVPEDLHTWLNLHTHLTDGETGELERRLGKKGLPDPSALNILTWDSCNYTHSPVSLAFCVSASFGLWRMEGLQAEIRNRSGQEFFGGVGVLGLKIS